MAEHDKAVNEIRSGLKGESCLIRLKHQREVDPVPMLMEHERKVMPPVKVLGVALIVAAGELLVPSHQLAHIGGVDRAGVRHLDHHTVLGEQLLESGCLFQNFTFGGVEGVVQLYADIAAGAENISDILQHFISGLVFSADVCRRIIDKLVINDSRVAGEV